MEVQSSVDYCVAGATLQQLEANLATNENRVVVQWVGSVGKATSPYQPLGIWAGPFTPPLHNFLVSLLRVGAK